MRISIAFTSLICDLYKGMYSKISPLNVFKIQSNPFKNNSIQSKSIQFLLNWLFD